MLMKKIIVMFGNPTVNLRRGWSGGHSHRFGPNFIDFEPLIRRGGYSAIPPKRLKIDEIRAVYWECPPDHPLLRLNVGFPNNTFNLLFYFI